MSNAENILGYKVSSDDLDVIVDEIFKKNVTQRNAGVMACLNPHSYVVAKSDKLFSDALHDADILLPDGVGIIYASKILQRKISQRIAGNDLFTAVMKRADSLGGKSVFFLGSTKDVLLKIEKRVFEDYPNLKKIGSFSPPFSQAFAPEENQEMIDKINLFKPDILWVGMTAPKQEKWIFENKNKLDAGFIGAIGAVFDFYAGTKYRAPEWVCSLGLEWLPRLLMEPRRLWRRNLHSSPAFLWDVMVDRFVGRR